jgi:hypothetical protein
MDVPPPSREEIVQADDLMPFPEQALAEVGPQEAGAAGNKDSHQ